MQNEISVFEASKHIYVIKASKDYLLNNYIDILDEDDVIDLAECLVNALIDIDIIEDSDTETEVSMYVLNNTKANGIYEFLAFINNIVPHEKEAYITNAYIKTRTSLNLKPLKTSIDRYIKERAEEVNKGIAEYEYGYDEDEDEDDADFNEEELNRLIRTSKIISDSVYYRFKSISHIEEIIKKSSLLRSALYEVYSKNEEKGYIARFKCKDVDAKSINITKELLDFTGQTEEYFLKLAKKHIYSRQLQAINIVASELCLNKLPIVSNEHLNLILTNENITGWLNTFK